MIELYWFSGSCNAWRVMLALEIKGVPYEPRLLTHSKGEHKTPEYLAINPRAKVPAIRDGAYTLSESVAILQYLERKFPEPPLLGTTPEEAGDVLRRVLELVYYLEPALDRVAIPIYRGRVSSEGEAEAVKTAAKDVHRELASLERTLATTPFLAGPSISAADCTAFPFVQQMLRASGKAVAEPLDLGFLPLEGKYPGLAAWVRRIEAIPGYERTYPPHWRA